MGTHNAARFERLLLAAVYLTFLAMIAISLCAIPLHISRNFNEGWNAYWAAAAMHRGVLYPAADSLLANNYPPLSFYIIGAVGEAVGDNIVAGRLVATLSLVVIAINVFGLSRWAGADRRLSYLTAGVFLLGVYVVMGYYIGIDDPQFLATALMTFSVLIFLRTSDALLARGMMWSAFFMVVGGLIKHSEISPVLAICTWSLIYDRRRLRIFLCFALVLGFIACGFLLLMWGRALVDNIFFAARQKWVQRAIYFAANNSWRLLPYILMAGVAFYLPGLRRAKTFIAIYLTWSILIALWMFSGDGVGQNIMIDVVIALTLGAGAFVLVMNDMLSRHRPMAHYGRAFTLVIAALPWLISGLFSYFSSPTLSGRDELLNESPWTELSGVLARTQGKVACETLAVCYWANKPMEVDFFNYGQKLVTGSVYADAPGGFIDKVSRKSYSYVVLAKDSPAGDRLPPVAIDILLQNYQPVGLFAGKELLLAPRR